MQNITALCCTGGELLSLYNRYLNDLIKLLVVQSE